jgi:hypothetical protein
VQNEQLNIVAEELKMIARVEKEAAARTSIPAPSGDAAAPASLADASTEPQRRA